VCNNGFVTVVAGKIDRFLTKMTIYSRYIWICAIHAMIIAAWQFQQI